MKSLAYRARASVIEALEQRCLLSVTLGTNFAGLGFNDTAGYIPPDTIAAAGPNHIVEAVNLHLRIYNKSGTILSTQSLGSFFGSAQSQSDPVVMFDESISNGVGNPAGRFIVGVLDFASNLTNSGFYVAVSNDADPTHGFTEKQRINLTEGANYFADYPRSGIGADSLVFTFNQFSNNGNGPYSHVRVLSIAKSSVVDQNTGTFTSTQASPAGVHFTMTPAVMHGASTAGQIWFVDTTDTQAVFGGSSVQVVNGTNLLTAPTFTTYSIPVTAYTLPPAAIQPGSGGTIETNDARILNAEWRSGRLVAAQCVGAGSDAHARFYEFATGGATPALTQQGDINRGAGVDTYFPSIAIAGNGDLGMTFMESSASEYMSAYVTGQNPGGAMQTPTLLKGGLASYSVFGEASPHRAGDYSGITVDPASPNSFWAANEYAASSGLANWGTWIGQFTVTTPPPVAPVIAQLTDSPDPVQPGGTVNLGASVSDGNGNNTITSVAFYRDDGSGVLDAGDTLLGTDTNGADGWGLAVALAANFPPATYTYLAQATDATSLTSNVASTTNTVTAAPLPPTISSLSDSPDPVRRNKSMTLTANGVSASAVSVSFYRDNGNGVLGAGDTLLGTDTSSSGGWTRKVTFSPSFTLGTYTYFAQAKDALNQTSNVVSAVNTVRRAAQAVGLLPEQLRSADRPVLASSFSTNKEDSLFADLEIDPTGLPA
jgi:hypothetical protein